MRIDINIFQNTTQKEILTCFVNGVPPKTKYPASVREFCIQISFLSQRTYRYIRHVFDDNLPGPSTIRSWYANCDLSSPPGINVKALQYLERNVAAMRCMNSELVCSISVDEMYIHQNIQWVKSKKSLLGVPTYGADETADSVEFANQAIVFMLCGVNERLRLPFAHHFVASLDGKKRGKLLKEVLASVRGIGIDVSNITFDGLPANETMCNELGANFDFNSSDYKPFIDFENGHKTYILKDAPHMLKLVRNALGNKKHFRDADGRDIRWSTIEKLFEFGRTNIFNLTHKLNQKHIEWKRNPMNVRIAVQTLSLSTANSLEILQNEGVPGFEMVDGEIEFIRCFNNLFDVFNTKIDNSDNPNLFKRALCSQNREKIFELFDRSITYIKGLKFIDHDDGGRSIDILTSRVKVGFKGIVFYNYNLGTLFKENYW